MQGAVGFLKYLFNCKFTTESSSEKDRLRIDRIMVMSLWPLFWPTLYNVFEDCVHVCNSLARLAFILMFRASIFMKARGSSAVQFSVTQHIVVSLAAFVYMLQYIAAGICGILAGRNTTSCRVCCHQPKSRKTITLGLKRL